MQAGLAANVIPATATLTLSVRALTAAVRERLEQRITELVTAQAASFGARAEIDYQHGYPVLVNHPAETELARAVALEWAGKPGYPHAAAVHRQRRFRLYAGEVPRQLYLDRQRPRHAGQFSAQSRL